MTQTLNCFIIDDSEIDRLLLVSELSKFPKINILGSYESCIQAQGNLASKHIDVVFVDIDMPDVSGLSFIKAHVHDGFNIVVVSSHPDYALEGFSLNIFDYILKPVNHDRLEICLSRLVEFRQIKHKAAAYDILFEEDQFIFKEGYKRISLHFSDVLYLEAYGDYTKIVTENKTFLTLETLGNLMKSLPSSRFIRVHRSYTVAFRKISKINARSIEIGSDLIPIGKTFYKFVKATYDSK